MSINAFLLCQGFEIAQWRNVKKGQTNALVYHLSCQYVNKCLLTSLRMNQWVFLSSPSSYHRVRYLMKAAKIEKVKTCIQWLCRVIFIFYNNCAYDHHRAQSCIIIFVMILTLKISMQYHFLMHIINHHLHYNLITTLKFSHV